MSISARLVAVLCAAGMLAACERSKSENPLSPTIAGPLPNVSMTPPEPIDPLNGRTIIDTEQPIALLLTNPTSSSPRPFLVDVQVATDPQFSSLIVTRTGIPPGSDGRTRVPLGDRLPAGRTYYWRGLANDGANVSGWSNAAAFSIVLPVVLGAPEPRFPIGNERVPTGTPEFRIANGSASGPYTTLYYQFQVSQNPNFTSLFTNAEVEQGHGGETRYTMPQLPAPDTVFYWRARLFDSKNVGPWSRTESFRSPLPQPQPPPGPGPGPGPAPGSGGSCASSDGNFIISCVGAKYPNLLQPTSSLGQRQSNMAFLRDRIIEAGRCGGLDLGWNLKRGGPELSVDYAAMRRDGKVWGVDLGFDYDNISQPLRLTWAPTDQDPFATYGGYTNSFSCG